MTCYFKYSGFIVVCCSLHVVLVFRNNCVVEEVYVRVLYLYFFGMWSRVPHESDVLLTCSCSVVVMYGFRNFHGRAVG